MTHGKGDGDTGFWLYLWNRKDRSTFWKQLGTMPDSLYTGLMYGPTGPDTKRKNQDTWGPMIEKAFEGNDNENFIEKTRIIGKYTFFASTTLCMYDVMLLNNKGGFPNAISRMKWHYVPWMGGTVGYVAIASAMASFRGKSDQWNHAFSGFCLGAVVGKTIHKPLTGFVTGLFLSALAYHIKDCAMSGCAFIPDMAKTPKNHGNPFSHKMDFTMVRQLHGDRPGYWARTPEEVEAVFKRGEFGDGNHTDKYKNRW